MAVPGVTGAGAVPPTVPPVIQSSSWLGHKVTSVQNFLHALCQSLWARAAFGVAVAAAAVKLGIYDGYYAFESAKVAQEAAQSRAKQALAKWESENPDHLAKPTEVPAKSPPPPPYVANNTARNWAIAQMVAGAVVFLLAAGFTGSSAASLVSSRV